MRKTNIKSGLTLIELLVGMIISAAIFLVATNLITSLFGSSTKQRQLETIEQTKNDLQQDIGNSVKWAEDNISFVDGILLADDNRYEVRDGVLYKNDSPLTSSEVNVESFQVTKYSTSQVAINPLNGIGLTGRYYNSLNFTDEVLTRIDPSVDFDWGTDSPDREVNNDHFSVKWYGQVETDAQGEYRFRVESNDGARLTVDDTLLIDDWRDGSSTSTKSIFLDNNKRYNITLEYYENVGSASISLYWSSPSFGQELIPSNRLYPTALQSSIEIIVVLVNRNVPDIKDSLTIVVSPRIGGVVGAIIPTISPSPAVSAPPTDMISPTNIPDLSLTPTRVTRQTVTFGPTNADALPTPLPLR